MVHLTVCPCYITCALQSEFKLDICLNVKELLAPNKPDIWTLSDSNGSRTHNHLIFKWTLQHLAKLTIWLSSVVNTDLYGGFEFMFLHVTYAFQSESTLYFCLNVKELFGRNRRDIWSLSDCSGTRTHNHLVFQRTLNTLAKLTKWLSWVVSTYLYGAFDFMFLSCHVRISEWIQTLYLTECQGTAFSK